MVIRRIDLKTVRGERARDLLRQEWLTANGLGGYASGTISGTVSWRYHGLLIAALAAPFGRMAMLNHLAESLRFPDRRLVSIGGAEPATPAESANACNFLTEFRLENGLPIWRYEVEGIVLEKHVLFLYGQNTVHINYHLLSSQHEIRLELRPSMQFRGHEQPVDEKLDEGYQLRAEAGHYEITLPNLLPRLRLVLMGDHAALTYDGGTRREIYYPKEAERGSPARGCLWSPGYFSVALHPRQHATLIASTEWWSTMLALTPAEAVGFYHTRHERLIALSDPAAHQGSGRRTGAGGRSVPDQPAGRVARRRPAHAAGDEIRTRDRRLPLVHRLGPRHDDQPRRPDA